jgi:hypothetical protein
MVSDDEIRDTILKSVEGEFSDVNPRRLRYSFYGNDQYLRELPALWVAGWSGLQSVQINDSNVNGVRYRIRESDERPLGISDTVPATNTITLSNLAHSRLFRVNDLVYMANDFDTGDCSTSALIDIGCIDFAKIGDTTNPANAIVTLPEFVLSDDKLEYYQDGIILLQDGNVIREYNWVTAVDHATGVITLKNNIGIEWNFNPSVYLASAVEFSCNVPDSLSDNSRITYQYSALQRFDDDEITLQGREYQAFLDLVASKICTIIAARWSRFQPETYEADAVDMDVIVDEWRQRSEIYRNRFNQYFNITEDGFSNAPAMYRRRDPGLRASFGLHEPFQGDEFNASEAYPF